jgi:hypothetical protein
LIEQPTWYGRADATNHFLKPVLKVALGEVWEAIRLVWVLILLAVLEAWSRLLGWYDFVISRDRHVVWKMAWTQKENVQRARQEQAQDVRSSRK